MANQDTIAPSVLNKAIVVTGIKKNSISIKWEKAKDDKTLAKDITYVIGLTEADNANDPWHIVHEEKDICEHTFKNLKSDTRYGFYVMAYDEAGNFCQYPLRNGCMTAKTLDGKNDRLAPTVQNKELRVMDITDRSISIKWEKAKDDKTLAKDIRYVVGLTEYANSKDPWHIVREANDISAHTFKGLKAGTRYAFYVMAIDEAGNMTQYPHANGTMTAVTKHGDSQAPIVPSKKLEVKDVAQTTISIMWERANDDQTKAKDIRYVVGLTETDNDGDPWHIVGEAKDICMFTFKKLKPGTRYSFFVMAFDEAGNMTQYPGMDKRETAMTLPR